jgi:dCMP deaminase
LENMSATARPSVDEYMMAMATTAALRGTCDRKRVGVVLARGPHILSTGYNGSMPGAAHCDEAGHDMEGGHCVRTTHAEINAILQAARHGVRVEGATAYVTASPCWHCFKALVGAGVARIVYGESYRLSDRVVAAARELRVDLQPATGGGDASAEEKAQARLALSEGDLLRAYPLWESRDCGQHDSRGEGVEGCYCARQDLKHLIGWPEPKQKSSCK